MAEPATSSISTQRADHGSNSKREDSLVAQRTAGASVADSGWHHILVEVDRTRADGVIIYVDGRRDDGVFAGRVDAFDLDNGGDVLVGGGPQGAFFRGDLDFLRICLGTLAEAHTTIDELRAWEFAGPQFADFAGVTRPADHSTAGALEAAISESVAPVALVVVP